MAKTITETVYVNTFDEFRFTIDRYIAQGGVVQDQQPGVTTLHVQKRMNVWALVLGLVCFIIPGVVYLIWYLGSDRSQVITVRMGKPDNLGGYNPGGTVPPAVEPPGPTATLPNIPAQPAPPSSTDPSDQAGSF